MTPRSITAWRRNWIPNDPEPYYSVGVIDWTACYQPRMEERAKLGMKPDEHLSAKKQGPEESLRTS